MNPPSRQLRTPEHNGRHQEEDAGHEGGEGQRHGPGGRLRAGRQGRQDPGGEGGGGGGGASQEVPAAGGR